MRLLEVIPTADTDPQVVAAFSAFADRILGKQVVLAHDTPNFIANRIGVANMNAALTLTLGAGTDRRGSGRAHRHRHRLAAHRHLPPRRHGRHRHPRPRCRQFHEGAQDGPARQLILDMVEARWLGDKSGQGFYTKSRNSQRRRGAVGARSGHAGLPSTRKSQNSRARSGQKRPNLPDRLRQLLAADPAKDKAAAFLWPLLANLWNYAADRIGEVADDAPSIDRAICAGFNWEMGPFAMWDAAGVARHRGPLPGIGPARSASASKPCWIMDLKAGTADSGATCYSPLTGQMEPVATVPGHACIADFRAAGGQQGRRQEERRRIARRSRRRHRLPRAAFRQKRHRRRRCLARRLGSQPASEFVRDFRGFVITSDQENFSVGANLMQLLLAMQEGEWEEVNRAIRSFQQMTSAIKFCPRPVVVAPYGLCLGGGTEISLHGAARQVHAELYMGLVEAGVGLIPGGGGTKEMALRACDLALAIAPPEPKDPPSKFAQSGEYAAALKQSLETIAMAKVSTSAAEARTLGLLAPQDRVTRNRDRLLLDAKAQAALLADQGYVAPIPRTAIPAAGLAVLPTLETGIFLMGEAGFASEHDQKVARKAAYVLCGGRVTPGSLVSEQYLLDLEREAFLSLCGERKTQERIAFTLKTGKPLRN
jgi:3-hydroxyacyl-CoA dehydrogenase